VIKVSCPQEKLPEWQELKKKLGHSKAMLAYIRNDHTIPTPEKADFLLSPSYEKQISSKESFEHAEELKQQADKLLADGVPLKYADMLSKLQYQLIDFNRISVAQMQQGVLAAAREMGYNKIKTSLIRNLISKTTTEAGFKKIIERIQQDAKAESADNLHKAAEARIAETFQYLKGIEGSKRVTTSAEANDDLQRQLRSLLPATYQVLDKDGEIVGTARSQSEAAEIKVDYESRMKLADENSTAKATISNRNDRLDMLYNYYNGMGARAKVSKEQFLKDYGSDMLDWIDGREMPQGNDNPAEGKRIGAIPPNIEGVLHQSIKESLVGRSPEELKEIIHNLYQTRLKGRSEYAEQQAELKRQQDKKATAIAEALGPQTLKPRAVGAQKPELSKKGTLVYHLLTPEDVMTCVMGGKGNTVLHKYIFDPIYNAYNTKMRGVDAAMKRFEEILGPQSEWKKNYRAHLVTIKGEKYQYDDAGNIVHDEKGEPKFETFDVKLTTAECMAVYAHSVNEHNRVALNRYFSPNNEFANHAVKQAIDALKPEQKKQVEALWKYYDEEQYQQVNPIFRKKHGVDMPKVDHYMTLAGNRGEINGSDAFNENLAAHGGKYPSIFKGMTKGRVMSSKPLKNLNFYDQVLKNMRDTQHYIAYSDALHDANALLNHDAVREPMDRVSAPARAELNDWLKLVAAGTAKYGKHPGPINDFIHSITGYFGVAQLGLKSVTIAKHITGLARGMAYVNEVHMARAIGQIFHEGPKIFDQIDEWSPSMKHYGHQWDLRVEEAFERNIFQRAAANKLDFKAHGKEIFEGVKGHVAKQFSVGDPNVAKWMMYGIGYVVKKVSQTVWLGKYNEALSKAVKKGMSADEAHDQAVYEADRVVRKSQQGGGVLTSSGLERSDETIRAMMQFMSPARRLAQQTYMLYKTKDMTLPQKARAYAYSLVVAGMANYMIQNAVTPGRVIKSTVKDKERMIHDMVADVGTEIMNSVPLIGQGAAYVYQKAIDASYERVAHQKIFRSWTSADIAAIPAVEAMSQLVKGSAKAIDLAIHGHLKAAAETGGRALQQFAPGGSASRRAMGAAQDFAQQPSMQNLGKAVKSAVYGPSVLDERWASLYKNLMQPIKTKASLEDKIEARKEIDSLSPEERKEFQDYMRNHAISLEKKNAESAKELREELK